MLGHDKDGAKREALGKLFENLKKQNKGLVPSLIRQMAVLDPDYALNLYEETNFLARILGRKTFELMALVVSVANGAEYCIKAHTTVAKLVGASDAEIRATYQMARMSAGYTAFCDGMKSAGLIDPDEWVENYPEIWEKLQQSPETLDEVLEMHRDIAQALEAKAKPAKKPSVR